MGKSLAKNTAIYTIKTIVSLLTPIITFPYVTRVISVAAIGKVNFATSICTYFLLIAGLGIYPFAIKEGAKIKNDKERWNQFASEILTFNLITTFLSMALFAAFFAVNEKWHDYAMEMLIISLTIPLTTVGVDWVFTVYEEYAYVTVRSITVQLLSVAYLLLFVKNDGDFYHYVIYTTFTTSGSYIWNFFAARKLVRFTWRFNRNLKSFVRPSLTLFLSSVATQIYLNSDITMLGYLSTDSEVGYYSASVKIYNIAKTVLLSLGTVAMPRLAYFIRQNQEEYWNLFLKVLNAILFLAVPVAFGLALVSKDVLTLFAGADYRSSFGILRILAFAIPCSILASYLASSNLVLEGKEKEICKATIIAAITNVVLNSFLLPVYGAKAAAFTTLIAEILTMSIHLHDMGGFQQFKQVRNHLTQVICSTVAMAVCCFFVMKLFDKFFMRLLFAVVCGVITYLLSMLICKNEIMMNAMTALRKKCE